MSFIVDISSHTNYVLGISNCVKVASNFCTKRPSTQIPLAFAGIKVGASPSASLIHLKRALVRSLDPEGREEKRGV